MNRAHLRAAAEAYADVVSIESDCYHYLNDGFCPTIQARIATRYSISGTSARCKYSSQVVDTALAELQYPINESTGYAWTGNQRAAFAGISSSTWHRNNLCNDVEFIIKDIRSNSYSTWLAIQHQLHD